MFEITKLQFKLMVTDIKHLTMGPLFGCL